jgi:uncharacterized protein (TIGR03435 family)
VKPGLILIAVAAWAQSPPLPQFEVVSIKPSPLIGGGIATDESSNPRSLTIHGILLKDLIRRAYSLKPYQVSGPGWMESEFYDLLAKTAEPVSDSVRRLMLQDLLAKRFELVAHFETKQLPSYELLVGEGGLKIRPVEPEGPPGRVYGRKNGVRAEQASMRVLADVLTRELDRPVLDKTGVDGLFDFDMKWTPLSAEPEAETGPSVFAAIRALGLKLEPRKAAVQVLVLDHVERPSPN